MSIETQAEALRLAEFQLSAQTHLGPSWALLSNLFNLAVERGNIDRNPCKEVRRNKEQPRTRLVEKQELDPFVVWALQQGPGAVVLVSMAQFTALAGSRRIEFRTLHWPQVDEEIVRLVRAKKTRTRAPRTDRGGLATARSV